MKIINFKKKKMKLLTIEQQESYENVKNCYICKEKLENKYDYLKKTNYDYNFIIKELAEEYNRTIESQCLCCNKDYQQKFDEKLKE